MVKKINKKIEDDDGRVICNMDVEGMRWYDNDIRRKDSETSKMSASNQLTRSEAWRFTWSALLAGLSIVAVFSVGWVLFILFCTQIWFR
jgi:hypothetical protein